MTRRSATWTVAFILVMQLTGVAEERRTVCLTVSPALQIAAPLKTAVIAEANNISLKNSTTSVAVRFL
jgi:hypothetical protein